MSERGRAAPVSRRLEVDRVALHVLEYRTLAVPSAPPLLLLHGGMAHARWWDPIAGFLGRFSRPFGLDRRGHGDSDWTNPESYGWERDLADIEFVLDALDPGPWVLAGHSQGGLLAADVAARGRANLAALVLIDVPLDPAGPRLRRTGESLRKVPQLRYPTLEDATRGFRPFPLPHRVPVPVLAELARHSFRPTDDGDWTSKFHWKMFQRARRDTPNPLEGFPERLRAITLPTLCLRGAESAILPADEHAEQTARIPRAQGREIAGGTHHLHVEEPEAVADAIESFLGSLSPS